MSSPSVVSSKSQFVSREPIAIVGISALMPGSSDAEGFWRDILEGADRITDIPESHWLIGDYYDADPTKPDKTYAKRGAFLGSIDFDPMEFGVPPSIVPATDTSQLLALVCAKRLLDDVAAGNVHGIDASKLDRSRMSVILGATSAQELVNQMASRLQRPIWVKALRDEGVPEDEVQRICDRISNEYVPWQESTFPGLLGNVIAGRIANRLDLGGTNCVTDAACASSFSALSMAMSELQLGDSDIAICGGVETLNDIFMFMCFSKTPALSMSGDIRPFSDKADGTMLGEGIAMVALKRLSDAEKQGDRIYAVIKGVGTSSDGRAKSVYAPVPEGQAKSLRRAYEHAGYSPDTVEFIEAHGTGTKAGDAAEFEGLRSVWAEGERSTRQKQWCALGTIKSQVGHTKACAGAAGLIRAVFALHHKVLPPTIKIDAPNPAMKIDESAFYLNTIARPWVRDGAHPRRASVSSFGFGGSNFHVALEEYTRPELQAKRLRAMPSELVLVTATDGASVAKECRAMAAECERAGMLVWFAQRSQLALRDADSAGNKARLAIVASSERDLGKKLLDAATKLEAAPTVAFSAPSGLDYAFGAEAGKVAFLFPGQGSQYVAMGADVAMAFDEARSALDRAADQTFEGRTIPSVIFPNPGFGDAAKRAQLEELTRTEWAQPAIGVTSASLLELARAIGLRPDVTGGHSYGELTALYAAGVLDFASFVKVSRARGDRMAEAARTTAGAMCAVPRAIEDVRALLDALPDALKSAIVVANHNGPKQVVVSGATDAIDAFVAQLAERGINAKKLPVATAFHSPIVAASSAPFRAQLTDVAIAEPHVTVFSNANAAPYAIAADAIRDTVAASIARPVRFVEQVRAMHAMGVRTFVEVGPHAVLTSLVDDCLADQPAGSFRAVALDRKGKNGVTSLFIALGRLIVAGVHLDPAALWARYRDAVDPRTKKKPAMTLALSGTNYGKPYPPKGGSASLPKPNGPRQLPEPQIIERDVVRDVVREVEVIKEVYRDAPFAASGAGPTNVDAGARNDGWIDAYAEVQRQTADAHSAYLKAMADSHASFLRVAEQSVAALSGAAMPGAQVEARRVEMSEARPATTTTHDARPATTTTTQDARPTTTTRDLRPVAVTAAPISLDLKPIMLSVVSEKTGYPADMLTMEMALEADLGIDSIKRVEILSAMKERVPSLPAFKAADMGALRTLGEIVAFMEANGGAKATAALSEAARPSTETASNRLDLKPIMLSVVSEKTGYPADMLTMEMALEADLGIDSIKRVEILSAMKERVPSLPAFKAADMGALRTLGEIVAFMEANGGGAGTTSADAHRASAAVAGAPVARAAATETATQELDLKPIMLAVVSEKTGYPAEMLTMEMALEADLGIDSIKRVEILSAMKDRVPNLPAFKAAEMGALRTLGEIVAFMEAGGAARPSAPTKAASPTVAAPAARLSTATAMTTAAPATVRDSVLGRFALREIDAPIARAARPLSASLAVFVTDDGRGIAHALAARLQQRGVRASVVAQPPAGARAVVFLGGLRASSSVEDAIAVNADAFESACIVGKSVAGDGVAPVLFVTVQATGGDFGLSGADALRAWSAGLSGLVKTAAQEWSGVADARVKALDLELGGRSADAIADVLAREILDGSGSDREVGLHADGRRTTLQSFASPAPTGRVVVDGASVVVASGGARGVTAATLIALAQATKASLVLLGRTPLVDEPSECAGEREEAGVLRALIGASRTHGDNKGPAELRALTKRVMATREVRETLAAIERAGSRAMYVVADVTDGAAIGRALDVVRAKFGPITGVVHGAGVLADKLLADKTRAHFDAVFDTKVGGLRALLQATARDPLAFLVMFSSVAGRCGNVGQSDYAMANEVLNKVAAVEARRRDGACVVRALGWGPWESGMVTPALKAKFAELGVPLIPLAVGAQMLVDELRFGAGGSTTEHEIVLGGEPRMAALASAPSRALESSAATETLVTIDATRYPALESHRIQGAIVVPAVFALELMVNAVQARAGGQRLVALRDLRVVKGVRLSGSSIDLKLVCKPIEGGFALELRSLEGLLHYAATAQLTSDALADAPHVKLPTDRGAPWTASEVYAPGLLFHGPAFQALVSLDWVGDTGASALVATGARLGWPSSHALGAWATDPALGDGGLQLARLWGLHVGGKSSLPTRIGAYVRHSDAEFPAELQCILTPRDRNDYRTITDLAFVARGDATGRVLAELRGVEMHFVTSESPSVAPHAFVASAE